MNEEGQAYLASVNCHQETCGMVRASAAESTTVRGPCLLVWKEKEEAESAWEAPQDVITHKHSSHSLASLAVYLHMFTGIMVLYKNAPGHTHSLLSLASQGTSMGNYSLLYPPGKPLRTVLIYIKAKTGTRKAC